MLYSRLATGRQTGRQGDRETGRQGGVCGREGRGWEDGRRQGWEDVGRQGWEDMGGCGREGRGWEELQTQQERSMRHPSATSQEGRRQGSLKIDITFQAYFCLLG